MNFDNILFAISFVGIILSLAYFRAAFRQWRFERALELRRLNLSRQTSDRVAQAVGAAPQASRALPQAAGAVPVTAGGVPDKRTCTVLDFMSSGARKARDAREAESGSEVVADSGDTRQRGGRTV